MVSNGSTKTIGHPSRGWFPRGVFLFSNLVPIKFYHYQGGCTIEKITRRLKKSLKRAFVTL